MSNLLATTYDYAVAVTKSDTVDDPAGPFAGLYVSAGGTLIYWGLGGPQAANPVTITVVAGTYVRWPIKRIGASTGATVFGLVGGIVRQGAF
jgi:hypothetical protein